MLQDTKDRLKRIEKELNAVLHTMADGVVIIDMEGRITYANPQAEKILGMRRNTIEGAYYFDNKWKQIDDEGDPLKEEELPVAIALKHKKSLKDYIHGITDGEGNTKKDQAITDERRYLLLELMGYLAGDYRHFAYGNTMQGEKQA